MSNLVAVKRAVAGILAEDPRPLLERTAVDAVLTVRSPGGAPLRRRGRRALAEYFRTLGALVTFWRVRFVAVGDRVRVVGTERYTLRSGLEGETEFALTFELRNGLITRLAVIEDLAAEAALRARSRFTLHGEAAAMPTVTMVDGTEIYYKDWGTGQPVVFSHGWPLTADAWEDQMIFLAERGYRCIAHDRRGHGRSSQPWTGNEMNTYADDLASLVQALDLKDAIHVGHSTGGGEVTRYLGRHGTRRVAKAVLIGAVPPLMLQTDANPGGLPLEVFDQIRAGVLADRSQYYQDLSIPFYGANRPGAKVSQGLRDAFWLQGMMGGLKNQYDCIAAFSATDFTEDLKKFDVPTLIIHGDDDQIVPIDPAGRKSVTLVPQARLLEYPGEGHGICSTRKDQVNRDLLEFFREPVPERRGELAASGAGKR